MMKSIIKLNFKYNIEVHCSDLGVTFAKFTSKAPIVNSKGPKWFKESAQTLKDFFNGHTYNLKSIPIDQSGFTPFQKNVYGVLKKVPKGKVVTYQDLAQAIGKKGASRAIGSAMRRNPIPLIIPCHRVIRSDGSLGNYSAIGGTKTKELLLNFEDALNA